MEGERDFGNESRVYKQPNLRLGCHGSGEMGAKELVDM